MFPRSYYFSRRWFMSCSSYPSLCICVCANITRYVYFSFFFLDIDNGLIQKSNE
ncbi:hypothetical protein BD770DRAFT_389335 [Pilaira anomala]|nr:hypothetical protein BD770DRAFT_389335 [Pilaira anomala]